jgi:hypothetical protein
MIYREKLESVWPLHGSVLVRDGIVYCVAGRNVNLDGGLRYLKLDARTGRKLSEKVVDRSAPPAAGKRRGAATTGRETAMPDILSSTGDRIHMRTLTCDLDWTPVKQKEVSRYLHSGAGFLKDEYFHRNAWFFAATGAPPHDYVPTGPRGRILVFDDDSVYGYGRKYFTGKSREGAPGTLEDDLFAARKDAAPTSKGKGKSSPHGIERRWERKVPIVVAAMVLSGEHLFVAGPSDVVDTEKLAAALKKTRNPVALLQEHDAALQKQDALLEGRKGAILLVVSKKDGKTVAEQELDAAPVFDGMAAAYGKLYVSMRDGTVRCLGK